MRTVSYTYKNVPVVHQFAFFLNCSNLLLQISSTWRHTWRYSKICSEQIMILVHILTFPLLDYDILINVLRNNGILDESNRWVDTTSKVPLLHEITWIHSIKRLLIVFTQVLSLGDTIGRGHQDNRVLEVGELLTKLSEIYLVLILIFILSGVNTLLLYFFFSLLCSKLSSVRKIGFKCWVTFLKCLENVIE